MNWVTKNYLRDNAENSEDLDNARWNCSSSGVVLESVSRALERNRGAQYLDFIYKDTSGLGPVEFIFSFLKVINFCFSCYLTTRCGEYRGHVGATVHGKWGVLSVFLSTL